MATPWETRGKKRQNPLSLNASPQKKVLSLVLCVAVMLSVMVLGAGAAFSDQADIENTEAVDACSALNIIGGYEDGSFHPERNIKRSEITKMICVALNGGSEPNVSTNAVPTFSDVRGTSAEWAEGYIEACVAQGIVSGVGGGRFNPDGNVTGAQLAKMLLVALGYNAETEKFTGDAWETNVNVRASQKSLYKGLENLDTSAAVTRDQAAQMVWNAMQAYEVEYKTNLVTDANGNLATQIVVQDKVVGNTNDKITLLRDRYDAWLNIGTLTGIDKTDLTITMSAADELASDMQVEGNVNQVTFAKLGKDYSSLLGQKIKVIFNANQVDQVLGVFATGDNTVYNVVASATSEDDDKLSFGGNTYSVEPNGLNTYVNGRDVDRFTTLAQLDSNILNPNAYTIVDSDGNGRLDALIVKTYDVAQVSYAASDRIIAAGQTYKYADENIADGIAKDDWVVITWNAYNDNWDVVKADVQTATLDALRDNQNDAVYFDDGNGLRGAAYSEYQIGGTWYAGGAGVVQDNNRSENDLGVVKATQTVDYVAVNGVIFYMAKSTGENTGRVDNVALVLSKANNGVEDLAKIAFFNGDTATVSVSDKGEVDFNGLTPGTVYEYTVVSGEYRFDFLQSGTTDATYENYYGDLTYRTGANDAQLTSVAYTGDNTDTFDGLKIDDNAQILLYTVAVNDQNNPVSANVVDLSGKQFNALDTAGLITTNAAAYGFSGDMSGLNRIGALALRVNNLNNLNVNTWANYGYIVSDARWIQPYRVCEYEIWNGTDTVTVREEINRLNERVARTLIGYDEVTTADGVNTITGAELLTRDNGMVFTAITDVSKDGKTITVATDDGDLDISGSTILYVDSENKKGMATGSVSKADQDTRDLYLANVLYAGTVGGEPDVVVVEQGRWLQSGAYAAMVTGNDNTIYGANADTGAQGFANITNPADVDTAAKLQALLDNNTKVTLNIGNYTLLDDITIPAGTELEIIGDFDMAGKTITNNGTLDVQGDLDMNGGTLNGGITTVDGLTTIASRLNGTLTTDNLTIGASGKVTADSKITVDGTLTLTDAVASNIEAGAKLTLNAAQATVRDGWFYQGTAARAVKIASAATGTYTWTKVTDDTGAEQYGWLIAGDTTTKTLTGSGATLTNIKAAFTNGYKTVVVEDASSDLTVGAELKLLSGQTLEIKGEHDSVIINATSAEVSVAEGATLKVGGKFTLTAVKNDNFVNAGTVEIGGDLEVGGTSQTFTSNGTTTVAGKVETSTASGDLAGTGSITVNGANQDPEDLEVAKDSTLTITVASPATATNGVAGNVWKIGNLVLAANEFLPANTTWKANGTNLVLQGTLSSLTLTTADAATLKAAYDAGITTVTLKAYTAEISVPAGKELVLNATVATNAINLASTAKLTVDSTSAAVDLSKIVSSDAAAGAQVYFKNAGNAAPTGASGWYVGTMLVSTQGQLQGKTFTFDGTTWTAQ